MQDPVADVLAERARGRNGFAGAVAISLILHGLGTAAALFSAMRAPAPKIASKLNIRFAPVTLPGPPVAASEPKPAAPRIEPPKPEPVQPPPPKKSETPPKNAAPPSAFGRSTKKAADVVPPPDPPRASSPAATSSAGGIGADIAAGQAGVTAIEGGDFPYTLYLSNMQNRVGQRWLRPQIGGDARAVVYFRIERDGTIRDAAITTASGNGSFDRAALRAVLEASPLPPLPFGYSGHYLGVHLTFR